MSGASIIQKRRVDAHQHFWEYDSGAYPWIRPEWPIRKSFLPPDLQPLLEGAGMDGCVAVQARQTLEETIWLLGLAKKYPFIAGVVGWIDLLADPKSIHEQLERIDRTRLVGVRHVVQDEPDDQFMLRPDFLRGIATLAEYSLAYDILIFPRQLPAAIELVRKFPRQSFVLDHCAKPMIRTAELEPWRRLIRELAAMPNVSCKLSGLVTEANWREWKAADFEPYLDVAAGAFGEDRLMIGSDWPVCLLSGEYPKVMNLVRDYIARFPESAQEKILGGNAARFYNLKF